MSEIIKEPSESKQRKDLMEKINNINLTMKESKNKLIKPALPK